MTWIQTPQFVLQKLRLVDDFTRPDVFLEEKSWPGLVACSQRPVLLIICEHTLQAHYHKEANTEGTHEIKVSLLKVIHIHIVQLLCMTIFIIAMVIVMNMQLKVTHMPPYHPASICHQERALLALRGQKPSPDLADLTIMRLVHGMITGQMQEWLLRT